MIAARMMFKSRSDAFPSTLVRGALREFWAQEAKDKKDDPFAPVPNVSGTIYEVLPELDSLTIVKSIRKVEKILGIEIPLTLIKAGGYCSETEFLDDMIPKFQKEYERRQKQYRN